jgi:alpha-tubulin suppressor-like RCC1 family protein
MSNSRTEEQKNQAKQDREDRDNAGAFRFQPKDVVDKMASFLDDENNATLRMTCRFFANNQTLLNTVKLNQKKFFALDNCTFILNSHGSLYGLGQIPSYLGGDATGRCIPITLPDSQPIAHIAYLRQGAIEKNSIAIICTKDGTIYGAGSFNKYGQLGLGHENEQKILTPIQIPAKKRIIEATLGFGTTMIRADDGTVLGCGLNTSGNLGLGDSENRSHFVTIPLPENIRIKKVALGRNHTIMLTEEGKIYGCGSNIHGQLSPSNTNFFQSKLTLIPIPENKFIQQIAATEDCTILVATDGTVYGCGANHNNLLCFANHTGSSWGAIFKLQLISIPDNKPIQSVSGFNTGLLFLARDGTVYSSGSNVCHRFGIRVGYLEHEPTRISILNGNGVKQISLGLNHSIMRTNDDIVYVCGDNSVGQLGFHKTITPSISIPTRMDIDDLLLQANQEEKPTLRMQMR